MSQDGNLQQVLTYKDGVKQKGVCTRFKSSSCPNQVVTWGFGGTVVSASTFQRKKSLNGGLVAAIKQFPRIVVSEEDILSHFIC